jgi:hypothetical protein
MSFLAPLFFVALAGLAVPVLLHLTQREKKQVVRFPSLMFVRRIPYQSVRRRKIQNWLLLLVRMAALALIVLAFARPLVMRATPIVPGTGAREVVILLDASYSMGYADRWDRARAAARNVINSLTPSDRASVVLFSSNADIALRSTAERDRLSDVIATATPTPGATRYAPALKVASSLLAESSLPRREVVLISDFQRNGWRGEEGAKLPAGATLTPVAIQTPSDKPNVTITGVTLARSSFSNQERVTVTAGVVNRSEKPVSGEMISLEVAGLPIASKPLAIEPASAATVSFDPFTVTARRMRATVRTSDDALGTDNVFNFVVSATEPVRLVLIDRGGDSSDTLYLSRALAIGDMPKFETVTRQPETLTDDDLKKSAAVILNDVPASPSLARRLGKYVANGGGLLVAAGPRATWPADVDVLPATLGMPVDRTNGDEAHIGALEYGSPIFEPFRAPRSGDFSAAHVYGYRSVSAVKGAQVLARFDAGTPAVVERTVGAGRVVLFASTLDNSWTDLPIKPVFLPFIHQAVQYLAAYHEAQPWLTVGQVLDPDAAMPSRVSAIQRIVLTPSGKRMPIVDEGSDAVELTEQGFYEVRNGRNDSDVGVIAANVDPAESDLTPMDPREIAAALTPDNTTTAAQQGVPQTPEQQEHNQRLWWYLLCGGVVLLGLDTLLSNRLAKA